LLTQHNREHSAASPLVSMIVLSYNHARFVLETLESVKEQTYKHTELIIVDDCSTDDSVAVIERWLAENHVECTFVRHEKNQGICSSLNQALAAATGKYLSMIASDDAWLPDKIERQVEIMERQPEDAGVLYSEALFVDECGQQLREELVAPCWRLPQKPEGRVLNALLEFNFIPGMTTLVRRSCYDRVGVYDENLPWEDWDMWMRIAREFSFVYASAPSAKYRIHQKSLSHSDAIRMLRQSCTVCLRQFAVGDMSAQERATLTRRLLEMSEYLYVNNDAGAPEVLFSLWKETRNTRAGWMYRFASLGVSFRNWQRVLNFRARLRRMGALWMRNAEG
jgi:glycosyltransferase involved in cell wall biosynthesis